MYHIAKLYWSTVYRVFTHKQGAVEFGNVVHWEVVWGVYVRHIEICDIPIGKEHTKVEMCGSAIWNEGFDKTRSESMLTG